MADAQVDALVIGGGVIGLAVARALALAGMDVVIAERAQQFGMETSSRNSEVIHAGIYYPPGSLKAQMCIEGRDLLYAFCDARGVAHRRCGKFIVATKDAQVPGLEKILGNARASGVDDLQWVDGDAVRALEPDILCERAILSPSTGIIDSHGYMMALLGEAEAHGAVLACHTDVTAIRRSGANWAVHVGGDEAPALVARRVINCAGLWASETARLVEGMDAASVPDTRYAKGCYFSYTGKTRFRHLIYSVPEPGGLGTHLTLDMAGGARFGPDVEWIDALDYEVPPSRHAKFLAAVRSFWPGVDPDKLQPAYAGVRPKIGGPEDPAADFRFSAPADHGVAGVFNLFGIESPGLTASLAIAGHVRNLVEGAA